MSQAMTPMDERVPLTPAEFDAVCRQLIERCPGLSETSGHRSPARNQRVGGSAESKHLLGMARDFVGSEADLRWAEKVAKSLGLWTLLHDAGSGDHLHVQGLPVGPVPEWWLEKYGA